MSLVNFKLELDQRIDDIEKNSDAEIMVFFNHWSDRYPGSHLRLGMFFSFLLPTLYYFSPWELPDLIYLLGLQLLGFLIGHYLAYLPTLKKFLATPKEIKEEVQQAAIECYHNAGITNHPQRLGMMVYLSLGERRMNVLWDNGLKEKANTDLEAWSKSTRKLMKKSGWEKGLLEGLETLKTLLNNKCPQTNSGSEGHLSNVTTKEQEVPKV